MLRYRGYGWVLQGLNLYGNYHLTDRTALLNDVDHRVDVGLLIEGQQPNGVGTGKIVADTLAIHCCQTAIKTLASPTEDNADQLLIGRLATFGCDTGLWSTNVQSVGIQVAHYEAGLVNTAFRFDRGGKLSCRHLSIQAECQVGLLLTGDESGTGVDQSNFHLDEVNIDGTAPLDCKVVETTQDFNAARIFIGSLNVPNARATAAAAPLFVIRKYQTLIVNSGEMCFAGMVKVSGGTSTHFPTIIIRNCRFEIGARMNDVNNLFDPASDGYVQVLFEDNWELLNDAAADLTEPVYHGEFYPNFRGMLTL
jgi:hypothetical protein